MQSTAHRPMASVYRVEVSGWDSSQTFFVEKSDLEWDEETGKNVVLNHSLREGAILFVRLLQPTAPDRSFPVPYEVEFSTETREGNYQFRIRRVRPRTAEAEEISTNLSESFF